jgi:hypothetical protein
MRFLYTVEKHAEVMTEKTSNAAWEETHVDTMRG